MAVPSSVHHLRSRVCRVPLVSMQGRQPHASVKRAQPGTTRTGPTRQSARLAPQARGAARVTGSALCAALASPTVLLLRLTRVLVQTAQPARIILGLEARLHNLVCLALLVGLLLLLGKTCVKSVYLALGQLRDNLCAHFVRWGRLRPAPALLAQVYVLNVRQATSPARLERQCALAAIAGHFLSQGLHLAIFVRLAVMFSKSLGSMIARAWCAHVESSRLLRLHVIALIVLVDSFKT